MNNTDYDFSNEIFTVSGLNNLLKDIFDNTPLFHHIHLKGELNGFKRHSSGHYFFSLNDEESTISAVIFSYQFRSEYEDFKDGDLVEVIGSLNIYNKRGTYNFVVTSMKHVGEGDLLLKKKQLIEKLSKEGLFDEARKKPIPKFPKNIGIVTSSTGAAIVDIEKNIRLRNKNVNLYIFPCIVQGKDAVESIIDALEDTKKYHLDTIIVGRGGGSNEDLSAFDDEKLVRELTTLKVPVISAVGHEINKSIVDYVSDVSVSTPTAAAIVAVQDENELIEHLSVNLKQLNSILKSQIHNYKEQINEISNLPFFKDHNFYVSKILNQIQNYDQKLQFVITNLINQYSYKIKNLSNRIDALSPYNVLKRGYAIISNNENHILTTTKEIDSEDEINIRVSDGETKYKRG